jgi:hypothetical protein
MTTTASKLFLGAGLVAFVAAAVYGWGTDGGMLGSLVFGFKGGAGELGGYTILLGAAATLFGLGAATSILRDADPEAQAAAARLDVAPPVNVPNGPSYVPVLAAFSAVLAAVGLVASPVVFVIGLLFLLFCVLEWMVKAWSERATGDPELNQQIRNRLMHPIEIPVFGAVGIVLLVVSLSRIFLTLDRNATSVVAILIGALITSVAFLVAYRPKVSKDAIAVVLVVFALLAIGGGILAAANGPREFEHHGEEQHEAGATAEEHSE